MTISNRAILFNNSGAQCLEAGHIDIARDLFRASLETKLENDRAVSTNPTFPHAANALSAEAREAFDCVDRAEFHLTHLHDYLNQTPTPIIPHTPDSVCSASIAPNFVNPPYLEPVVPSPIPSLSSRDSTSLELALYDQPFSMHLGQGDSEQCMGAINIFNLGLVHHLQDRFSVKARAFYQIASALLTIESGESGLVHSSSASILVRAAVLNNLGVWHHDSGEAAAAQDFFRRLANLLTATAARQAQGDVFATENAESNNQMGEVNFLYVLLRVISRNQGPPAPNATASVGNVIPDVPRKDLFGPG